MTSVDVDVILPVLDEREALPWVLRRLPEGFRPIVADNGSTDGSAELARALGARVGVAPPSGFRGARYPGARAGRAGGRRAPALLRRPLLRRAARRPRRRRVLHGLRRLAGPGRSAPRR